MDKTGKEKRMINEVIKPRKIVAYIRVSTDQQDIGKQRETLVHYSKRAGLMITRFVGIEISATKGLVERKLEFFNEFKEGDILI